MVAHRVAGRLWQWIKQPIGTDVNGNGKVELCLFSTQLVHAYSMAQSLVLFNVENGHAMAKNWGGGVFMRCEWPW